MSIKIADAQVRDSIEAYTQANTFPNVIKFIEDKAGNWCTSNEVLTDKAYAGIHFDAVQKELAVKGEVIAPNPKDAVLEEPKQAQDLQGK